MKPSKNEVVPIQFTKDEVYLTKRCQWIKTLTIRNGSLQITSNKLM